MTNPIDPTRYVDQRGRVHVRDYCPRCSGTLTTWTAEGKIDCPDCAGTGKVWRIEQEVSEQ